ncbi:MAG: hypothetical protein JSV98_09340 [candidate division WOR-3 bacterium]|nr:MAG: hypothetical protein JSV98_09340 [candidate division WOR-3 bacterium]
MTQVKHYDSFPVWIPILSTFVSLLIYTIGFYVFLQFSIIIAVFYILYCLWVEMRVLTKSCVSCYYYGKVCGLGRGVLCSLLFKKGDPAKFVEKEVSWIQIVPDFLVFIFPLLGGIVLLITDFSYTILLLLIFLFVLSFVGSAVIRGSFACKYCKQREIGCPAEKLFSKQ